MALSIYIAAVALIYIIFNIKSIWKLIEQRYRLISVLSKIDGPLSLPIVGTTYRFKLHPKEFAEQLRDWGLEYSRKGRDLVVFWIGPQPLVIALTPKAVKTILESNTVINKSKEYDVFLPWLGTGLLLAGGQKWRQRRKMLTPSFHFNVLQDFQPIFNEQSKILINQLSKECSTNKDDIDVFPFVKRCALDIICETAMGSTVNAQTCHNHPYVQAVSNMNKMTFQFQRMPWLWFKPLRYLTGFESRFDKNLSMVTSFTKNVIEQKLSEPIETANNNNRKKAFLDLLIEQQKEGGLSYEDIREEVDTFMFEGHDTTSTGIGWTLWCLANKRDYQVLVHEELDVIFGDSDRDCTIDDIKQMKMLDKCIKEALRLRPSVPQFARTVVEDLQICDKIIPSGASVMVSPAFIHNHPNYYDDPLEYNPERFNDENVAKRQPYTYFPFSAGPRNCIGQKFAVQEEKTVISWILRRFEVSSNMGLQENIALPETILRPELGFPMKLTKRQSQLNMHK